MNFFKSFWVGLICGGVLTGCDGGGIEQKSSQVVARVNGEEITVHQLTAQVARVPIGQDARNQELTRVVLERLIGQELLAQKAKEVKLDRDPQVMQAMEDAKRMVLTQAYLQRTLSGELAPAEEEIYAYYNSHPEMYAKRKLYKLEEVLIPQSLPAEEIKLQVESVTSLTQLVDVMRGKGIEAKHALSIKSTDQLPAEVTTKLAAMQIGDTVILPEQGRVLVLRLTSVVEAPLSAEEAVASIKQNIISQRRTQLAEKEIQRLRKAANIEYLGAYRADFKGDQPR